MNSLLLHIVRNWLAGNPHYLEFPDDFILESLFKCISKCTSSALCHLLSFAITRTKEMCIALEFVKTLSTVRTNSHDIFLASIS